MSAPSLNSTLLGDVAVIGNFDAISTYSYSGQDTILAPPVAEDQIILQTGPLEYTRGPLTNGKIFDVCDFGNSSVAFVGNFTNVLSENSSYAAILDLDSGSTTALPGLPDQAISVWCNSSDLWVGGAFGTRKWNGTEWRQPEDFGGFSDGTTISAIVPWQGNLVFGGAISGIRKDINGSQLEPGTLPVMFAMSQARGYPARGQSSSDASGIFCGEGWSSGLDSTTGSIDISIGYELIPAKLKISNSDGDNATKTWRLTSNGGILNLTYTDTAGNEASCDAFCSLEKGESIEYEFVNTLSLSNFSLELLDFYGSHASLQGIELYQQGIVTYANNSFDTARQCQNAANTEQNNLAVLVGDWHSQNEFMYTNLTTTDQFSQDRILARFLPAVNTDGDYEVRLFTPGCQQDDTCSQRGIINATVVPGFGLENKSTVLYQTNDFIKYDTIYNGTLRTGAYIELQPAAGQPLPRQFVAYRTELMFYGNASSTTGPLFEYSKGNWSISSTNNSFNPVGGTINSISKSLGANAVVDSIISVNDSLVVAGANLTNLSSIFSVDGGSSVHQLSNLSATKLQRLDSSVAALTSNSTYSLSLDGNLESIGPASQAVVPLSLNGTNFWALDTSEGLKLFGISGSTTNVSIRGHLSACVPYNRTTSFYFGSLQVADSVADDVSLIRNGTPTSILSETRSKSVAKYVQDAGSEQQFLSAIYLNDSTAVVTGEFNGSSIMVISHGKERVVPGLSNAEFVISAAFKDIAILGGSEFALFNSSDGTVSTPNQPGGRVQALALKPNSSEIAAGGQFGLRTFNFTDRSWYSTFENDNIQGNVTQVQWTTDGSLLVGGNFSVGEKNCYLALLNSTGSKILADQQDLAGPVGGVVSSGQHVYIVIGENSTDSSKSFLSWFSNGKRSDVQLPFSGRITSLALLPVTSQSSSFPLSQDRVLALNGAFSLNSVNTSSIIWDGGSNWQPYVLTADNSQGEGYLRQFASQKGFNLNGSPSSIEHESPTTTSSPTTSSTTAPPNQTSSVKGLGSPMAVGHVVGVSCAIAVGCLCLVIIAYLMLAYVVELSERDHEGEMRVAYQSLSKAAPPEAMLETKTN